MACFAFILYWIEQPRKALVLDPTMSVFTRPEPTRAYTHINIIWRKKENHGSKKSCLTLRRWKSSSSIYFVFVQYRIVSPYHCDTGIEVKPFPAPSNLSCASFLWIIFLIVLSFRWIAMTIRQCLPIASPNRYLWF